MWGPPPPVRGLSGRIGHLPSGKTTGNLQLWQLKRRFPPVLSTTHACLMHTNNFFQKVTHLCKSAALKKPWTLEMHSGFSKVLHWESIYGTGSVIDLANMYFIVPLICNDKVKINDFRCILLDILRIFNFPLC